MQFLMRQFKVFKQAEGAVQQKQKEMFR